MNDPLDNMYALDKHLNQSAFNGLMDTGTIEEELLWTAHPSFIRKMVEMAVYYVFLLAYCYWILIDIEMPMIFILAFGTLIFSLKIILKDRVRRRTFYGISAQSIWVQLPEQSLKKYTIASLTRLANKKGTLSYATIFNSEYEEHLIMKNVPDAERVLALIKDLQEEQKQ